MQHWTVIDIQIKALLASNSMLRQKCCARMIARESMGRAVRTRTVVLQLLQRLSGISRSALLQRHKKSNRGRFSEVAFV